MQWIARASRTHITIAVAAIFAFTTTFAYLQSLDKTFSVAQLKKNVNAGEVISNSDIQFVEIQKDDLVETQVIDKSDFEKKNFVARVDLASSDLLTASNTVRKSTESGLQSLSIGISIDRANGGDIKKDDFVDVWQTGEGSALIAQKIPVRNVISPNKRLGISTSQNLTVVLAVTPYQAKNLSSIVGSKDIMIVISTGTKSIKINRSEEDQSASESQSGYEPLEIQGTRD